jgi:hypothetical protein
MAVLSEITGPGSTGSWIWTVLKGGGLEGRILEAILQSGLEGRLQVWAVLKREFSKRYYRAILKRDYRSGRS